MGEPAGIGPEIALAAFDALGGRIGSHPLKLVGDADIFAARKDALLVTKSRVTNTPGKPDTKNAAAVIEAIEIAAKACLAGEAAAMVTAPIHKAVLKEAGFPYPATPSSWALLPARPRR